MLLRKTGYYKFDDWKKLTKEQKDKVLETRGTRQQPETPTKRGIASLEIEDTPAKRTLGMVEADCDEGTAVTETPGNGDAGSQFG
jgi:hypothetical protein